MNVISQVFENCIEWYFTNWNKTHKTQTTIKHFSVSALLIYILFPTVKNMFLLRRNENGNNNSGDLKLNQAKTTNRPDKYPTGLFNNRNDCFANSTIQALSALQFLSAYLNDMQDIWYDLKELETRKRAYFKHRDTRDPVVHKSASFLRELDRDHLKSLPSNATITMDNSMECSTEFKNPFSHGSTNNGQQNDSNDTQSNHSCVPGDVPSVPLAPLHKSLMNILFDLQKTNFHLEMISLRFFFQDLEKIFNAKISTGQNDSHEFQQIILQKLQEEYDQLLSYFENEQKQIFPSEYHLQEKDYKTKLNETIKFVKFPVDGKLCVQLVCLKCNHTSKLNTCGFNILSLPLPQTPAADLNALISNNQMETIEGYYCVVCNLINYINIQKQQSDFSCIENDTTFDQSYLSEYKVLLENLQNSKIHINQDISPYFQKYLQSKSNINTNIVKKTVVVKAPEILIIHLGRSIYNGMTSQRNDCNLTFTEALSFQEQHITQDSSNISVEMTLKNYKLQSLIRHQGTHQIGHYECYKRKPMYYKNLITGEYINKSIKVVPRRDWENVPAKSMSSTTTAVENDDGDFNDNSSLSNETYDFKDRNSSIHSGLVSSDMEQSVSSSSISLASGSFLEKRSSVSSSSSMLSTDSSSLVDFQTNNSSTETVNDSETANLPKSKRNSIKSKVSGLLSRRSSVSSESSGEEKNKKSSASSVSSLSENSSAVRDMPLSKESTKTVQKKSQKQIRKLKSCIDNPFWKISDFKISEAKISSILKNEKQYCYMLYYELNDSIEN